MEVKEVGAGGMADASVEEWLNIEPPAHMEGSEQYKQLQQAANEYAAYEAVELQQLYHNEIAALTPERAKWPYEVDMHSVWKVATNADKVFSNQAAIDQIEPDLREQIELLKQGAATIRKHATTLEEAIHAGTFKRKNGEPWAYQYVEGSQWPFLILTREEEDTIFSPRDYEHVRSIYSSVGLLTTTETLHYDPEEGILAAGYEHHAGTALFRPHNSYGLVVLFVALGYETELRDLFNPKPKAARKKTLKQKPADIAHFATDNLTNTVFFTPHSAAELITPDGIITEANITDGLDLIIRQHVTLTDEEKENFEKLQADSFEFNYFDYRIYKTIASRLHKGEPEITVDAILSDLNKNPSVLKASAGNVQAIENSVRKLKRREFTFTFKQSCEGRGKFENARTREIEDHVLNGALITDRWGNGTTNFTFIARPLAGQDLLTAVPAMGFAADIEQIASIRNEVKNLRTKKRTPSEALENAWDYLVERAYTNFKNEKVLVSTMLETIGVTLDKERETVQRKWREQGKEIDLKKLEKQARTQYSRTKTNIVESLRKELEARSRIYKDPLAPNGGFEYSKAEALAAALNRRGKVDEEKTRELVTTVEVVNGEVRAFVVRHEDTYQKYLDKKAKSKAALEAKKGAKRK
jgi:hypothetical protein